MDDHHSLRSVIFWYCNSALNVPIVYPVFEIGRHKHQDSTWRSSLNPSWLTFPTTSSVYFIAYTFSNYTYFTGLDWVHFELLGNFEILSVVIPPWTAWNSLSSACTLASAGSLRCGRRTRCKWGKERSWGSCAALASTGCRGSRGSTDGQRAEGPCASQPPEQRY